MRSLLLCGAVLLAAAAAAALKAHAEKGAEEIRSAAPQDATEPFSDDEMGLSLRYPAEWKAFRGEAAPGGAAQAVAGSVFGDFRMASACFAPKRCKPGDLGKGPEAHLVVTRFKSLPKAPGASAAPTKGESVESGCDIVERSKVKWGGIAAPWVAMRCPEKKKWRYTASVSMQRSGAKGKGAYSLMCTMVSQSKDKAESEAEYRESLKAPCQAIVASTRFLK